MSDTGQSEPQAYEPVGTRRRTFLPRLRPHVASLFFAVALAGLLYTICGLRRPWELVRVLDHGEDAIMATVSFSADGRRLLSGHVDFSPFDGSVDSAVMVWDVESGRRLGTLKVPAERELSASLSHDGRRVLTLSDGHLMQLWDASTGRQLVSFPTGSARVLPPAFSPDGSRVFAAEGEYLKARIWCAETGKELAVMEFDIDEPLWRAFLLGGIVFSPDRSRVLWGGDEHSVALRDVGKWWDPTTWKERHRLAGFENQVYFAQFSPDGRRILTASLDETAQLWDAETGRRLQVFRCPGERITSVLFSPDGRRIVTSEAETGIEPVVRLRDCATGEVLRTYDRGEDWFAPIPVAFSPDGHILVTEAAHFVLQLCDPTTGKEFQTLSLAWAVEGSGRSPPPVCVDFSRDSGLLAATSHYSHAAMLWRPKHPLRRPEVWGFILVSGLWGINAWRGRRARPGRVPAA